ncbi:class I SAM-dependent methyltransferase [Magnetospirillum sp. 64-120]|uniref:class I SAM-dependent methyltransferase n=1 Tax=Magnetospirillum sp. 64-120 TaxID=1895778 RepID=UPI000B1BB802|nr:class I SAM-dependent methyltransferase [Magnetospirillum sp. 64-120]
MKKYGVRRRETCRICGSSHLEPYLDLGDQPPSNSFISAAEVAGEQRFPLRVYLCRQCGLSQLLDLVSSEDIFDEYAYLSSTSRALCAHYQGLVDQALALFSVPEGALCADIGCNDGIMLNRYPAGRMRLLGIEPSSAGEHARAAGHQVVQEFFDAKLGARLAREHGRVSLVTSTNVFAHVDDITSFARGVAEWLADDGVWVIEFPYLVDTVDRLYFDTVYHEHLSYLALTPLARLFAQVGLRAFRVERVELGASGPALRLFVCLDGSARAEDASIQAMLSAEADWGITEPQRYHAFAERVAETRQRILALLAELKAKGETVAAYCAPAKGNTLLNYLGVGPDDIFAVSENNDLKIGKLTPGTHIPVISDQDLLDSKTGYALLLAWNYLDFFLAHSDFIKAGGRFIVPLPEPVIRP